MTAGVEPVLLLRQNVQLRLCLSAGEPRREAACQQCPKGFFPGKDITAGFKVRQRGVWHPEAGRSGPAGGSVRNHAGKDDGPVIDLSDPAWQTRVAPEAVAP